MQIDWFTFTAQIFNFLILVWLLKRLLYQPVLTAIANREQSIAEKVAEAAARESTASTMIVELQEKQAEMAHMRDSQIAEMESEIERLRQQQLAEMNGEVAQAKAKWYAALKQEQDNLMGELRERIAREVQGLTRHMLSQLADESLERRTIEKFRTQIEFIELPDDLNLGSHPVVIRTAFELPNEIKAELQATVATRIGEANFEFEVDETLICGIEVVAGHEKYQWNIDSELDQMEEGVLKMLQNRTETHVTV